LFSAGNKTVTVARKKLTAPYKNEEEPPYNCERDDPENLGKEEEEAEESEMKKSIKAFLALDDESLRTANLFNMKYGPEAHEVIEWKILGDTEYITPDQDPLKEYPEQVQLQKEIHFEITEDVNKLADILFEDFFPCIKGHTAKMDQYCSHPRSSNYETVRLNSVKFHDPNAADPDWILKQAYLLMLAACTEGDIGALNLWKRGRSGGRHIFPDFGKCMPFHHFMAFMTAAPFMFMNDESKWYEERRNVGWEVFEPALSSFNERRRLLFIVMMLI
jgi:hypothetical protein